MKLLKKLLGQFFAIVLASILLLSILAIGNIIIVIVMLGLAIWFVQNATTSVFKAFVTNKGMNNVYQSI